MKLLLIFLALILVPSPFQTFLNAAESAKGKYVCQINDSNPWLKKYYGLEYLSIDFVNGSVNFGDSRRWLPQESASIKKIAIGYKIYWDQPLRRLGSDKEVIRYFSARVLESKELQLFWHCKGAGFCGRSEVKMTCKSV